MVTGFVNGRRGWVLVALRVPDRNRYQTSVTAVILTSLPHVALLPGQIFEVRASPESGTTSSPHGYRLTQGRLP